MDFYSEEEIRSRLGISTFVFHGMHSLDKIVLEGIHSNGIRFIEIYPEPEQFSFEDFDSMSNILMECRDIGLSVISFHCPEINYSAEEKNERCAEVERSIRMIDTLFYMGGQIWVIHADISKLQTKRTFKKLAKHYKGQNVYLTIENGKDLHDYANFVDAIDNPQVGMIVDIGHTRNSNNVNPMILPFGPTEQFRIAGHRLKHLHLHDFSDERTGELKDHRSPFDGEIQWVELFQSLKEINYDGVFMFEPGPPPYSNNPIERVGSFPKRLIEAYDRWSS